MILQSMPLKVPIAALICFAILLFPAMTKGTAPSYSCVFLETAIGNNLGWESAAVQTYQQILKDLTPGEASRPVWSALLKNQNPYDIPADVHLKSDTLRQALLDFKELVTSHGLSDAQLRPLLLNALSEQLDAREKGEGAIEVESIRSLDKYRQTRDWKNDAIPFYGNANWLVGEKWGLLTEMHFVKRQGNTQSVPFPDSDFASLQIKEKVWRAVNPATGEFYYGTHEKPHTLFKMPLFDSAGEPLKKLEGQKVELPLDLSNKVIRELRVSPDGATLLFKLSDNSLVQLPAKDMHNPSVKLSQTPTSIPKKATGLGFLDSQRFYYKTGNKVVIKNLDGSDAFAPIVTRAKDWVSVSADGNRVLSLTRLGPNVLPVVKIYDTTPGTNLKKAPLLHTVELDHTETPIGARDALVPRLFLLPGNSHLVEIFQHIDRRRKTELRLIDVKTSKTLHKEILGDGVYRPDVGYFFDIQGLRISSDGNFLQVDRNMDIALGWKTLTFEWAIDYLKSFIPGEATKPR